MMISDFHSHTLPGIDDGSASPEESLAMLAPEASQGLPLVAATPHFYAHRDTIGDFPDHRDLGPEAIAWTRKNERRILTADRSVEP